MTKPLKQIANASKKFAQGDFTARVPVQSSDEIGELTTAFNNMADSLEKSEDLPEIVLSWEFRIDFETAKAFRKSGGNYLRAKQWEDLTVEVRIS